MNEMTGRIPVQKLRSHVSELPHRVEAGETLKVTVNDRPVALPVPGHSGPMTVRTRDFLARLAQADPALADELATELTETTDDPPDP